MRRNSFKRFYIGRKKNLAVALNSSIFSQLTTINAIDMSIWYTCASMKRKSKISKGALHLLSYLSIVFKLDTNEKLTTQLFSICSPSTLGTNVVTCIFNFHLHIVMPPSKKGGHIALPLSVCRTVCRSFSSFRSFSLHWLHIMKWNLVYISIIRTCRWTFILGMIESFLTELWPLNLEKNSNNLQLPLIFFTVVAHTEIKSAIQIYHNNI
jgi:hypothetical protein